MQLSGIETCESQCHGSPLWPIHCHGSSVRLCQWHCTWVLALNRPDADNAKTEVQRLKHLSCAKGRMGSGLTLVLRLPVQSICAPAPLDQVNTGTLGISQPRETPSTSYQAVSSGSKRLRSAQDCKTRAEASHGESFQAPTSCGTAVASPLPGWGCACRLCIAPAPCCTR